MGLASKISGLLLVEQMVVGNDGGVAPRLVGYPTIGLLAAGSMIAAVFLAGRLRRAPVAALHISPEVAA